MASQVQHRQARVALKAALLEELRKLFSLLNPVRLGETIGTFSDALVALLTQYGKASADLGATRYEDLRAAAGVRSPFTVPIAEPADEDQIRASVRWATHAPSEGAQGAPDAETMQHRIEGASLRMMRQPDRETIARAVTDDPEGVTWARVPTGPTTCYFCAMLATRGAVYHTKEEAGGRNARGSRNPGAGEKFIGEGRFKFHDHCDCDVVPVFSTEDYEPSEQVQNWEHLYIESTSGVYGKAKIDAFRKAFEGRS